MGDVFKEQLIKKENTTKSSIIKGAIIAGAFLICFAILLFGGNSIISALFPVIFLIIVGVAYFLFTMQNIEYEYIYTNGELDIDRITNKSRRKRVFSSDIRAIEIMAHIEDNTYTSEFRNVEKVMDFSSGKIKPNTYIALISHDGKKTKLILEPNDTIQQAMSIVLTPRKFHAKK